MTSTARLAEILACVQLPRNLRGSYGTNFLLFACLNIFDILRACLGLLFGFGYIRKMSHWKTQKNESKFFVQLGNSFKVIFDIDGGGVAAGRV